MGLFDIFKSSSPNPGKVGGIYSTQVDFNKVFDERIDISENTEADLDSILDNYTKSDEVSTEISGNNIIKDISSAAISFAKSYFAFKTDGIELVKKERDELQSQMNKLDKLSLKGTDNYKRLKKRIDIANEIVSQNLVIEKRIEFSNELLKVVPSIMIISFKDFETIISKYEYTKLTTLSELRGEVTDHNIKVLTDLSEYDSRYSLLKYNIGCWKEDESESIIKNNDVFSNSDYSVMRLSVVRSVGKTDEETFVDFPTPFLLAFRRNGYKDHSYSYHDYEYEDTHFSLWHKEDNVVSKCPIFGKLPDDPLIISTIEDYKEEFKDYSPDLLGEVIMCNSAALAISPDHPENLPIVFQIFNKGILIYDLIGCQDYSSFPNMNKYYEDKSKEHK